MNVEYMCFCVEQRELTEVVLCRATPEKSTAKKNRENWGSIAEKEKNEQAVPFLYD